MYVCLSFLMMFFWFCFIHSLIARSSQGPERVTSHNCSTSAPVSPVVPGVRSTWGVGRSPSRPSVRPPLIPPAAAPGASGSGSVIHCNKTASWEWAITDLFFVSTIIGLPEESRVLEARTERAVVRGRGCACPGSALTQERPVLTPLWLRPCLRCPGQGLGCREEGGPWESRETAGKVTPLSPHMFGLGCCVGFTGFALGRWSRSAAAARAAPVLGVLPPRVGRLGLSGSKRRAGLG